jgi:hypothetical protein
MANYLSSRIKQDLGPSVTSALGAAYDATLQSVQSETAEFFRYSLARHLMNAAFAGERDPELLQQRASAYVQNWLNPPRLAA